MKNRIGILVLLMTISCASQRYVMTPEAVNIKERLAGIHGDHQVMLLADTPYQTPCIYFEGNEPGPAMLIIGGTHGNEPAGYEAALRTVARFEQKRPPKGKVIIIPLANIQSIEAFERRIPVPEGIDREQGNLNRCYPGDADGLPMQRLAAQIQLVAEENNVQVFIDLHEAVNLLLDTDYESEKKGLGQTIIYHPNEAASWYMINMLDAMNETSRDPEERFTALEGPIRNSAAWWAGNTLNCAAFTFETARKLPLQRRIADQMQLLESVFRTAWEE